MFNFYTRLTNKDVPEERFWSLLGTNLSQQTHTDTLTVLKCYLFGYLKVLSQISCVCGSVRIYF